LFCPKNIHFKYWLIYIRHNMFQSIGSFVSFQGFLNNSHNLIEGQCASGSQDCELKVCHSTQKCSVPHNECILNSNIGTENTKKCKTAATGYRIIPSKGECIARTTPSGNNYSQTKLCNKSACNTTNCLKVYDGELLPICNLQQRLNITTDTKPNITCVDCGANSIPVRDIEVVSVMNLTTVTNEAQTKGVNITNTNKYSAIYKHIKERNKDLINDDSFNLLLYKKGNEYYITGNDDATKNKLKGKYNRCFTCDNSSGYEKDTNLNHCIEKKCSIPRSTDFDAKNIVTPTTGKCKPGAQSTIPHGDRCETGSLKCKSGYTITSVTPNCDKGTFKYPRCDETVCKFKDDLKNIQNGKPTQTCPTTSNSVKSRTTCGFTCNQGYTKNNHGGLSNKDIIYCEKGTTYKPTCTESTCNFSTSLGTIQDGKISQSCSTTSNSVSSGYTCDISCNQGYTKKIHGGLSNQDKILCKKGQIYKPTCLGNDCTIKSSDYSNSNLIVPTKGVCNIGSVLKHGKGCDKEPRCLNTHKLDPKQPSKNSKCEAGVFKHNKICIAKQCVCKDGTAQPLCSEETKDTCKTCNTGYQLTPKTTTNPTDPKSCIKKICGCKNGTAQPLCSKANPDDTCKTCNTGYHLETKPSGYPQSDPRKCLVNKCTCNNGTGSSGPPSCINNGNAHCKSCNSGFKLNQNNTCEKTNKCTCNNGNPLTEVSGDNQCPFSTNKEACFSCNSGYYKRRANTMKELDTIVAETTSKNGGVVLSFLEDISNLKLRTIITDGYYSIAIDGSNPKKLNIKIGSTRSGTPTKPADSEQLFMFTSNSKTYTIKLPKTNDTVMKYPLDNSTNKMNNGRVLRNFLEKEYPATCKEKACKGVGNTGKWRDFDDGGCHIYCNINSSFTVKDESGKKVYTNKKPNGTYKLTTDSNGLQATILGKRYFPVSSSNNNPPMSRAPIINDTDLNKSNYEITVEQNHWLNNPHDINLRCKPDGLIDIVDTNNKSIITKCFPDDTRCSKHTLKNNKNICGRYVILTNKAAGAKTQWNKAVTKYASSTDKKRAWENDVLPKIEKRIYQCEKPKAGYFLGQESTTNPFGTSQIYKYTGKHPTGSWIKQ
jgi:hypothetical protein